MMEFPLLVIISVVPWHSINHKLSILEKEYGAEARRDFGGHCLGHYVVGISKVEEPIALIPNDAYVHSILSLALP